MHISSTLKFAINIYIYKSIYHEVALFFARWDPAFEKQPRYVGTTDWTASGKCGAPNDQTSKFAWRQFLSFTMDPRFQDDPSLTKIDAYFYASIKH